jgi:hypothetical protein
MITVFARQARVRTNFVIAILWILVAGGWVAGRSTASAAAGQQPNGFEWAR